MFPICSGFMAPGTIVELVIANSNGQQLNIETISFFLQRMLAEVGTRPNGQRG